MLKSWEIKKTNFEKRFDLGHALVSYNSFSPQPVMWGRHIMHHHVLAFSPMGWNKNNNSAFQGKNVSAYIEDVEWASLAQIGMMIWFWLVPFGDVAIKTVPMHITNYEFAKNGLVEGKCWSSFKITHILPNLSTTYLLT